MWGDFIKEKFKGLESVEFQKWLAGKAESACQFLIPKFYSVFEKHEDKQTINQKVFVTTSKKNVKRFRTCEV